MQILLFLKFILDGCEIFVEKVGTYFNITNVC